MARKKPPQPTHVPGTHKGEETTIKHGKEPGRKQEGDSEEYRTARDSTSIDAEHRDPIDPEMPHMPPA